MQPTPRSPHTIPIIRQVKLLTVQSHQGRVRGCTNPVTHEVDEVNQWPYGRTRKKPYPTVAYVPAGKLVDEHDSAGIIRVGAA